VGNTKKIKKMLLAEGEMKEGCRFARYEDVWGHGGVPSLILNLRNRWMSRRFYSVLRAA
jgi:hypothetical protein